MQQRRPRIRRPPVDPHGEHDQRCGFAVSLRRHDIVQSVLEKKMKRAGKAVHMSLVTAPPPAAPGRALEYPALRVKGPACVWR